MSFIVDLNKKREAIWGLPSVHKKLRAREEWADALPEERQTELACKILEILEKGTDVIPLSVDEHPDFDNVMRGFVTCGLAGARDAFMTAAERSRSMSAMVDLDQRIMKVLLDFGPDSPSGLALLFERVNLAGASGFIEAFITEGTALVKAQKKILRTVLEEKAAAERESAEVSLEVRASQEAAGAPKPPASTIQAGAFDSETAVRMVAEHVLLDAKGSFWCIDGPGMLSLIDQQRARAMFASTTVMANRGVKKHPAFDAWLTHPMRPPRKIIFDPGLPPGVGGFTDKPFNRFPGFAVDFGEALVNRERDATKLKTIRRWLHKVLCAGHEEHYEWLLNWCAHLVQRPGRPMGAAPVMYPHAGVGKSLFFEVLVGGLFHRESRAVMCHAQHLTGRFNGHLENKLFVFSDEALFAGDRAAGNQVKTMLSSEAIHIEPKGRQAYEARNTLNLGFASNSEHPMPMDAGLGRRLFFLNVAPATTDNRLMADQAADAIASGGLEQFWLEMRARDIRHFRPNLFPANDANMAQMRGSGDAFVNWAVAVEGEGAVRWLENGIETIRLLPCDLTHRQAHEALLYMTKGAAKYITMSQMVTHMSNLGFKSTRPRSGSTESRPRVVQLPELELFKLLMDPHGKIFTD